MLLQLDVESHEKDVEGLFFSGAGDLSEAVLELGYIGVWVFRFLSDGIETSPILDVGSPERVFPYPVPFELFPVRRVR